MREVGHGLWEQHQDLKLAGANLGTRMNIAETESGLFVHSPIRLTPQIQEDLKKVGVPQQVIAPNLFHHMFVGDYLEAYPGSAFYTIPELAKRRQDLANPIMIEDGAEYPWSQELDHFVFHGGRWFKEVIFLHKPSKTLILTDFAFNLHDTGNRLVNYVLKLTRSFERFGQTALEKLLIRDRQALRRAYDQIMTWDFDRISVTHGLQVEQDGKRIFAEGMAREL